MQDRYKGYALLFITSILFSTNILAAKFAIGVVPPFTLAFFRWFTAFILLFIFAGKGIRNQWRSFLDEWPHFLLLGITGMFICGGFVYKGAETTSGTNIALIYSLAPVLIILFSHYLFREKMKTIQFWGAGISFLGVLLLIFKGNIRTLLEVDYTVGDLWILAACISWAVYSLKLKKFKSGIRGITRLAFIASAGAVSLLPVSIAEHITSNVNYSWSFFGIITAVAIFPSLAAFRSYELCQEYIGAAKASMILYITPVVNALLVYLFLGETIEPYHIAGGLTVLLGVYLTTRH